MPREIQPDGDLIRKLRDEKGLEQHQLAQAAGCSEKTLSSIESGKKCFKSTLLRIATALKVDIRHITIGSVDNPLRAFAMRVTLSIEFGNFDETDHLIKLVNAMKEILPPQAEVVMHDIKPGNSTIVEFEIVMPMGDAHDEDDVNRYISLAMFNVAKAMDELGIRILHDERWSSSWEILRWEEELRLQDLAKEKDAVKSED